jgi:hypothetical protein
MPSRVRGRDTAERPNAGLPPETRNSRGRTYLDVDKPKYGWRLEFEQYPSNAKTRKRSRCAAVP